MPKQAVHRREFLSTAVVAAATATSAARAASTGDKALIAITLDLEMSRNFPTWETTHWDYEKGNLNEETKAYALEAARRVKARGGRVHFFVLGRTLEQENIDWLKELAENGHPLGNHTYDHVNIRARKPADIQFRFQRSPWLIAGREPIDVIRDNIRLTTEAMKSRLGVTPSGFRTPGGFVQGLSDREDLQKLLQNLGFTWISSKYPGHQMGQPGKQPSAETIADIQAAAITAQPFRYATGLIEVPMSPISDIGAFRTGRWQLDSFLKTIRAAVASVIERRAVFDFLGHPSCLYITDPEFKTIDLICDLVDQAGPRAMLADLKAVSDRIAAAGK